MNKVLYVLVYVVLAAAGAALYFEMDLSSQKEAHKARIDKYVSTFIEIAKTTEVQNAKPKADQERPEAQKDNSPVEAKIVETPDTKDLLDGYQFALESKDVETLKWDGKDEELRKEGYASTLSELVECARAQRKRLNDTRDELVKTRKALQDLVGEYNDAKPGAREAQVTVLKKEKEIEALKEEKKDVEGQLAKVKSQVDDLNAEIKSLKDAEQTAKDETEAVREDLAKSEKLVEQLKNLLKTTVASKPAATAAAGSAVTSLKAGSKGRIVDVNAKLMFAVVEFTDEAMQELLGPELQGALPPLEMGLRRTGFQGPAGEYVGRIRLRQAVSGKNFVIADVLGDWLQAPAVEKNDDVFAE